MQVMFRHCSMLVIAFEDPQSPAPRTHTDQERKPEDIHKATNLSATQDDALTRNAHKPQTYH
jgi:hypothetical protein